MTFYQGVLGGNLTITRRADVDPSAPEGEKHLVVSAALDTGTMALRASDRADTTNEVQTRVELSLIGTDDGDLRRIFDSLSVGGTVKAPLEKMFWGDTFGAFIDRFGIGWQVDIASS
jgi:PhnB protein